MSIVAMLLNPSVVFLLLFCMAFNVQEVAASGAGEVSVDLSKQCFIYESILHESIL
jgi:hypothetical protein